MPKKISVSLKLDPDQKKIFDELRAKHDSTQQQYLVTLVMLDGKFDLISMLGDPVEDKFPDDDFVQFAERVKTIKPLFDELINAEELPQKIDAFMQYLNPAPVTTEEVAPEQSSVTDQGAVDPVQAAAIAQAGQTPSSTPGNVSGLLPSNILNPPINKHALYAEIGMGQDKLDRMRTNQLKEAQQELAERKRILSDIGGENDES